MRRRLWIVPLLVGALLLSLPRERRVVPATATPPAPEHRSVRAELGEELLRWGRDRLRGGRIASAAEAGALATIVAPGPSAERFQKEVHDAQRERLWRLEVQRREAELAGERFRADRLRTRLERLNRAGGGA